jgi:hypothetical protein
MEVLTTVQNMDLYANSNRICEYYCNDLCHCDYVTETVVGPLNRGCTSMWPPRRLFNPEVL